MPNETFAIANEQSCAPALLPHGDEVRAELFESAPGSYVVLTPDDFSIVAASAAYLADTKTKHCAMINRPLLTVFPEDGSHSTADVMRNVRKSLERVRDSHAAHILIVDCYPARCPWKSDTSLEARFSRVINSPVFSDSGELIFIIHRIQPVAPLLCARGQKLKADAMRELFGLRGQLRNLEHALRSFDRRCTAEGEPAHERLRKSTAPHWPGAAQFRLLADSMPDKVLTARADGEIDYFNRRWLDFTGLETRELHDSDWPHLVHPEDVDENVRRWKHCVATGEFFEYEHRFRRADGEWRWHISRAHPMRNETGRIVAWIASNTEIDAVKRGQARAEQANRAKDQFLANLSHELRTPLTPVLMCAAALERETALQPRYRRQLGMMRRNVELEARLIDDLLDVTRITRGKLNLSVGKTDMHQILRQTEQIVAGDARAKKVYLRLIFKADEHHVLGDSDRLHQVCWNILKNAINFTSRDGYITVTTTNPTAGRIRLDFTDTGIGIDESFRGSVFEPFRQGDEQEGQRARGGLGLGMSICKAIVELHGGTIDVASEGAGKGTTFSVEFATTAPRESSVADRGNNATTPTRPEVPQRSLRLLLVEDHPPTLEVLMKLLRKHGHTVAPAMTVKAARDLAAEQPFDLVISDLGLPDGNGVDLLIDLTRDYGLRGIALSGYGMHEDLARTKSAGFIAHLIKPIEFEELQAVLAEVAPVLD